jgi:hypothetical protein
VLFRSMRTLNEAISGCRWLRARYIPPEAVQAPYYWTCTWEGDEYGLEYERFKAVTSELEVPLRFGFTGAPAYAFDVFKISTAYHVPDCPVRCPFYKGSYRYHEGLCPTAEDLIPRLVQADVMETAQDEIKRRAGTLSRAIQITERG